MTKHTDEEFEICRTACYLWQDASNAWMERAVAALRAAPPASPLRTVDVVARCMEILEDVPGEHLIDRVHRIVDWHHQLSEQYHDRPASPLRGRSE